MGFRVEPLNPKLGLRAWDCFQVLGSMFGGLGSRALELGIHSLVWGPNLRLGGGGRMDDQVRIHDPTYAERAPYLEGRGA